MHEDFGGAERAGEDPLGSWKPARFSLRKGARRAASLLRAGALKLGCPSEPGQNTIVRGSKPVSQGRETCRDFRILGMCPGAVQGSADITNLYTVRFGAPPAGKKVYIQVNQFIDGWEDLPVTFSAIVPAGT